MQKHDIPSDQCKRDNILFKHFIKIGALTVCLVRISNEVQSYDVYCIAKQVYKPFFAYLYPDSIS